MVDVGDVVYAALSASIEESDAYRGSTTITRAANIKSVKTSNFFGLATTGFIGEGLALSGLIFYCAAFLTVYLRE